MKLLTANGLDVNDRDRAGMTPLSLALLLDEDEAVGFLRGRKAEK